MNDVNARSASSLKILLFVLLAGLNLRPFLVAPGPVMASIVADIGLTVSDIALLTLLPMLLMGIGAFYTVPLQSFLGTRRGVLMALLCLALGCFLRLYAVSAQTLLMTAALCGLGVAFLQGLLPGIIKAAFPRHTPVVTGFYSASLMVGGALGARLMPALTEMGFTWQAALAWLAVPGGMALLVALMVVSHTRMITAPPAVTRHLLQRPRTWSLMAAFGMINGGYASMVTWLAPFYQQLGLSSAGSANLVAVMAVCQAIAAVGLPVLVRGYTDRRPWLLLTLLLQGLGFCGLILVPHWLPFVWVALCGAGLGGSFALAMVTALDHIPDPGRAGALAALMQGGGFMLAAVAPYLFGLLRQWSGHYSSGWELHLLFVGLTALIYLRFNPAHYSRAIPLSP